MRWTRRVGEEGHVELDKTEARQGDEHNDNGPPLVLGTLAVTIIFALMLAYFWYTRTH
jgi:hypothetical protein